MRKGIIHLYVLIICTCLFGCNKKLTDEKAKSLAETYLREKYPNKVMQKIISRTLERCNDDTRCIRVYNSSFDFDCDYYKVQSFINEGLFEIREEGDWFYGREDKVYATKKAKEYIIKETSGHGGHLVVRLYDIKIKNVAIKRIEDDNGVGRVYYSCNLGPENQTPFHTIAKKTEDTLLEGSFTCERTGKNSWKTENGTNTTFSN